MNKGKVTQTLILDDNTEALSLCGQLDQYLRMVEDSFSVNAVVKDGELAITGSGSDVGRAVAVFSHLLDRIRSGRIPGQQDVRYAIRLTRDGEDGELSELVEDDDLVLVTHRGKQLRPKTLGQKEYVGAMKRSDVVFSIGPAGTGKTYLAVAIAVAAYQARSVHRIVLTRPAVEAGERLGFLPGDLQEKVNPYLRPLYDALFDTLGVERFEKYMGRGIIEVAPLAYMRGRTLDDAYIILDEAQNTTPEQMKMLLTRLGTGSKLVVTGDITQIDLPKGNRSGLAMAREILGKVEGIEFIYLTERDVVRHELVARIINAYEQYEGKQSETEREAPN